MTDSLTSRSIFSLIIGWYKTVALLVLNSIVIFLLLNLFALVGLKSLPNDNQNPSDPYTQTNFQKVYPNYNMAEINSLLSETHDRGFMYDPYMGYKEKPFKGHYVTVADLGYRQNGLNQVTINDSNTVPVYIFGGSTAFGYGVADSNTIGAYLDGMLKKKNITCCVYNFGAGGYFSNQELIFFKRVLANNRKPAIAIFIDGLNELRIHGEDPLFASDIRKLLGTMKLTEDVAETKNSWLFLSNLPILQLYHKLSTSQTKQVPPKKISPDKAEINKLISRYKTNCLIENAIAKVYGIKTLFVIQPIPYYNYNLAYHVFKDAPMLKDSFITAGYSALADNLLDTPLDFLWLADIQNNRAENFYVDDVHYNPKMNQMISEKIFQKIDSIIPDGKQ